MTDDSDDEGPTRKLTPVSDEGPTGKHKPVKGGSPSVKPRKMSAPREAMTVPAPPEGTVAKPGDAPPRVFTKGGVKPVSSGDSAPSNDGARTSATRWESLLDDVLNDEGPSIEEGGEADVEWPATPTLSGAPKPPEGPTAPPKRRQSAEQPQPPKKPSAATTTARGTGFAPPPPRMPTLGPEPEFSFGLETPPLPEQQDPPRRLDPRGPSAEDLSWSPSGPSAPPAARVGANKPLPSSIPLPLEPLGGEVQALVERASGFPPGMERPDPRREMQERLALGDFTGALAIAEAMLSDTPDDKEANTVADECRSRLKHMYISRLGGVDLVPVMIVPRAELKWLSLDHRAGFLLSQFDGSLTVEDILTIAGMPELEVLRTLWELVGQRVIELRKRK